MSDPYASQLANLASCTDTDELIEVGCDLADLGREADAERCFRRAADLGDVVALFNLGNSLSEQERWVEAVDAYERAASGGERDAWLNLGNALEVLGDLAGALRAYRESARAGDAKGMLALAFALEDLGDQDAADAAVEQAVAAGNPVARGVRASRRWCTSLDRALEAELREGAEHYPPARADLASLLRATDRVDEARRVLERGAKLGERECLLPLGNLYSDDLGDDAAAEVAYREGIDAGDTYCHHNLGVLLESRGDFVEAEIHYRLGSEAGDALAAKALRELLDEGGPD